MARKRTTESASRKQPGQLGMIYGHVRRTAVDVHTLTDAPVPFTTLCGDWLAAAGFPLGQRYVAECERPGVITLVATDDKVMWEQMRWVKARTRPHRRRG